MRIVKWIALFCLFKGAICVADMDHLWVFEENFVKLGKKETYEKYKKGLFEPKPEFFQYAYQDLKELQYLYLTPVDHFEDLGPFFAGLTRTLSPQIFIPYASSLNFSIRVLHNYLLACSFIPQKESFLNFPLAYFYTLTIEPVNASDLESHMNKLAQEQKEAQTPICFCTWKELLGEELPKYVIGVFGGSEKEIEKFVFLTPELTPIMRKQNVQKVKLRKDLSLIRK